ncbi:hypothetical protein [Pseudomonas aeruginosa]|uniref:hypothetical protein n=1 Tax=Pseudomonas aeruginosa TaxID=287 RepID=UPI0027E43559|nr:hypothetical protein [Pseudomonas aeruginosa]
MKTFLLCAALLGAGLAQAADDIDDVRVIAGCRLELSLIHISEPTRHLRNSYAVFCLKKKRSLA